MITHRNVPFWRDSWFWFFIPAWLGTMTFFAAFVMESGWNAIPAEFLVMCSFFVAGDLYESLRDRIPARILDDPECAWLAKFLVYIAVMPWFPILTMHALHDLGFAGLEASLAKTAFTTAGGLAMLYGFVRCCNMPLSTRKLFGPLFKKQ